MSHTYEYPRAMNTVDCIIRQDDNILLIKRGKAPFKGLWALPGGFVDMDEDPRDAIVREVKEELGLALPYVTLAGVYGKKGRDPRGHVISVVWECILYGSVAPKAGDDALEFAWFSKYRLSEMAFDHTTIITENI